MTLGQQGRVLTKSPGPSGPSEPQPSLHPSQTLPGMNMSHSPNQILLQIIFVLISVHSFHPNMFSCRSSNVSVLLSYFRRILRGNSSFTKPKKSDIFLPGGDICYIECHSKFSFRLNRTKMSERKVLNKYYPPDFDPSKIPKVKGNRNATFIIRVMAPCNMRCTTCGEYIYKVLTYKTIVV